MPKVFLYVILTIVIAVLHVTGYSQPKQPVTGGKKIQNEEPKNKGKTPVNNGNSTVNNSPPPTVEPAAEIPDTDSDMGIGNIDAKTDNGEDNSVSGKNNVVTDDKKSKDNSLYRSTVDMRVVYGQYNNMLSTINLSQEEQDFVYLLNSYFKRSNDYGYGDTVYANTSFYENRLAFTGNALLGDSFYSIFDTSVDCDSRGMYDKEDYSREEKEKVKLSSKNVKKFSDNLEGYAVVGGAFYKHRLEAREENNNIINSLNRYSGEIGGDLIWSASNRVRGKMLFSQYNYSKKTVPDDRYVQSQIVDDFKFTNMLMFSFGLNLIWNKDEGLFAWDARGILLPVMPIASVAFTPVDFLKLGFAYSYSLEPFRPEDYYFEQNYIYPTYDLPPSKVHDLECYLDIKIIDAISLKGSAAFYKSDNFYNYIPSSLSNNLLTAHSVNAQNYITNIDMDIKLLEKKIRLILGYQNGFYKASENITYKPIHTLNGVIKFTGNIVNVDWSNRYIGKVFVDPNTDKTLPEVVVGGLDVQLLTIKSFYAYFRFENIYNVKYKLRDGYPEAGFTTLFGLRILI